MLGHRLPRHLQVVAQLAQRLPILLVQFIEQFSATRRGERFKDCIHRYISQPFSCMSNKAFQLHFVMICLNREQLPFVGISYEFVGEKQGAPFSAYIVSAKPGQGPPLHTHPYVEVAFTIEGRASITVGDETRDVQSGRSEEHTSELQSH